MRPYMQSGAGGPRAAQGGRPGGPPYMRFVSLVNAIRLALTTVREHKMRSFLTVLGVIIGTGTIICVG